MRGLVYRWLINAAALGVTAYVMQGIHVRGVLAALVASALLGIVNAFIRPVLLVLTLPLNILTLGLFTFVINGLMLLLVSSVVKGFDVDGFWYAVGGALLLSLVSSLITLVIGDRR